MKKVGFALLAAALTLHMGWGHAADYTMNEVVVTGEKDQNILPGGHINVAGTMGILGNAQFAMDIPFTQINLTEKALGRYGEPTQALDSSLRLNPSVRGGGSHLHNDFSIRGLGISGSSIYFNGIPGLIGQFNAPTYFVEQIDITSGPDSILTGVMPTYENSYAGGIVNFVSKKANEQDMAMYKQTFSGHGHVGEYLDISRRFGKDHAWGVRMNAEVRNGETSIDNERISAKGIFVNIDHRGNRSTTNLLTGYQKLNVKGGARWFILYPPAIGDGSITKLPMAPNGDRDFGFEGMEKDSANFIVAFNHEQELGEKWKVFFNAGYNDSDLSKNITGTSSRYTIINDEGDLMLKWPGSSMYGGVFSTQNYMKSKYVQLGFQGEHRWKNVKNTLTVAANKSWMSSEYKMYRPDFGLVSGNLYHGNISVGKDTFPAFGVQPSDRSDFWGVSIVDYVAYKKWQIMIGGHKHVADYRSYSGGKEAYNVKSDAASPLWSLVYQPNRHLSFYFSHSENFDQGTIVPSYYANGGMILPPAKVKQEEIGVKWLNGGWLGTFSLFSIKQANNIDINQSGETYYLQDGEQEYTGAEAFFAGQIARKWTGTLGLMYLDARYTKTKNGIFDGRRLNGQADWSGVLALEYKANEQSSLWGRMYYMGSTSINEGRFIVPSYTTFDLGVDHIFKWNRRPFKLTVACYNISNKNYWMAKGNSLYLSIPRTFGISASVAI